MVVQTEKKTADASQTSLNTKWHGVMSKKTQLLIINVFNRSHHGKSQPMCMWQFVTRWFLRRGIVSPLPNFQAEGPLVVGYLLFIDTLAHSFRVWRPPIQSSVWGHALPLLEICFRILWRSLLDNSTRIPAFLKQRRVRRTASVHLSVTKYNQNVWYTVNDFRILREQNKKPKLCQNSCSWIVNRGSKKSEGFKDNLSQCVRHNHICFYLNMPACYGLQRIPSGCNYK
jgi:hypothetical protein